MSDTARLVLFVVVVTIGAVLAALKVISGDAWLTLAMGLLLPSPLEGRRGGPGAPLATGVPAVPGVGPPALSVEARFAAVTISLYVASLIQWLAGVG